MTKTDTATVEKLCGVLQAYRGGDYSSNEDAADLASRTLRALAAERDKLRAENRDLQLQMIANDGQAQEAYEAQVALKAENERLRDALMVAEPALRYSSSVIQNLENVISDYRQDWVQADTAADIALAALEATK